MNSTALSDSNGDIQQAIESLIAYNTDGVMVVGGNNNNSSTNNNGSIVSTDVSMVSMVSMGSIGASRVVVSTGSIGINHSKVWKHYFDFIVSLKNFVATEFDMVINQYIHTAIQHFYT